MTDIFQRYAPDQLFHYSVHRGLDLAPSAFPAKRKFILSDQPISAELQSRIGPHIRSLDELTPEDIAQSVFYTYFLCDTDALPSIAKIVAHRGTLVPQLDFSKTEYRFVDRLAHDAMKRTWNRADRVSHLVPEIHENICEALAITSALEGDYVEVGVFLGGSALTALNYLDLQRAAQPDLPPRRAWLLDTFNGFDYDEAARSADAIWVGTHGLYGRDQTMAHVRETLSDVRTPFELVASNICADPLPAQITKIAVANIDVDMYEPTVAALAQVADRVVDGGIILCEDPTSTPSLYGALLAMEQFLQTESGRRFIKLFKYGQYVLIKQPEPITPGVQALSRENAQLKRLLAEAMLKIDALGDGGSPRAL